MGINGEYVKVWKNETRCATGTSSSQSERRRWIDSHVKVGRDLRDSQRKEGEELCKLGSHERFSIIYLQ